MQKGWNELAENHDLKIMISGIPSLSTYSFLSDNALKYKTFVTQEMLKMGFLASTNFYASIAHKKEHFDAYFVALDKVYKLIAACENDHKNIDELLEGPVCHAGFKRLN
jgi:hypothetical protein